jgi:hypothetical protein
MVLGTGIAHADPNEDCLHQDAVSAKWATAQQQQLQLAGATVTMGLLYTETNGEDPTSARRLVRSSETSHRAGRPPAMSSPKPPR